MLAEFAIYVLMVLVAALCLWILREKLLAFMLLLMVPFVLMGVILDLVGLFDGSEFLDTVIGVTTAHLAISVLFLVLRFLQPVYRRWLVWKVRREEQHLTGRR